MKKDKNLSELDQSLFVEATSNTPDRERIKELIKKGANLNAIDSSGSTILSIVTWSIRNADFADHMGDSEYEPDYLQFLLDLGADPSIDTDEGFNCLFNACLSWRVDIFEMLLKAGADANCISYEDNSSILDWVSTDQYYEEHINGIGGGEPLAKMVELLKQYGGKHASEIFTDKVQRFIDISPWHTTGIFTLKGNIKIEDLPGVDGNMIKEFNAWLTSDPEDYDNYTYDSKMKIINPPDMAALNEFIRKGLSFSKNIKWLVGKDIVVKYHYVKLREIDNGYDRNVKETIIDTPKKYVAKRIIKPYKLFLDDIRSVSMVYKNQSDKDYIIVRNFEDFKSIIFKKGLPEFISFDNDLGLDANDSIAPDGYAAAKWLVYESGLDISELKFYVHSANVVAKDQIKSLLDNYIKHIKSISNDSDNDSIKEIENRSDYKNELYLVRIVAKAYNTLDYKLIIDNVAKDIVYESQWVIQSLNGISSVSKYLRKKFKTIKESGAIVYAEIGFLSSRDNRPCLIMSQSNKEDKNSLILFETEYGKIKRIDICAIPDWKEATRTNEYPT